MSGGRVLVVDDTAFNRRLLVRLLADIGHEAIEAEHGRAALDLLRDPDTAPVDGGAKKVDNWTSSRRANMAENTLDQVERLVDQLSPHEQARLLAFLALRMAQEV